MPESDDPGRDAIGHYWDALVRGEQHPDDALDPVLTDTITWVMSQDDAPRPDLRFVTRLEEQLMVTSSTSGAVAPVASTAPWTTWNGRAAPGPHLWPGRSEAGSRRRWALAQLATAALLTLTLVGSFLAFGPGRPVRQDEPAAVIPAISGTPMT